MLETEKLRMNYEQVKYKEELIQSCSKLFLFIYIQKIKLELSEKYRETANNFP